MRLSNWIEVGLIIATPIKLWISLVFYLLSASVDIENFRQLTNRTSNSGPQAHSRTSSSKERLHVVGE
jgi:hypothetical protein